MQKHIPPIRPQTNKKPFRQRQILARHVRDAPRRLGILDLDPAQERLSDPSSLRDVDLRMSMHGSTTATRQQRSSTT